MSETVLKEYIPTSWFHPKGVYKVNQRLKGRLPNVNGCLFATLTLDRNYYIENWINSLLSIATSVDDFSDGTANHAIELMLSIISIAEGYDVKKRDIQSLQAVIDYTAGLVAGRLGWNIEKLGVCRWLFTGKNRGLEPESMLAVMRVSASQFITSLGYSSCAKSSAHV